MKTYFARNRQEYGEYGFNPFEGYYFKADTPANARHWVINHLDISIQWQIIPCI